MITGKIDCGSVQDSILYSDLKKHNIDIDSIKVWEKTLFHAVAPCADLSRRPTYEKSDFSGRSFEILNYTDLKFSIDRNFPEFTIRHLIHSSNDLEIATDCEKDNFGMIAYYINVNLQKIICLTRGRFGCIPDRFFVDEEAKSLVVLNDYLKKFNFADEDIQVIAALKSTKLNFREYIKNIPNFVKLMDSMAPEKVIYNFALSQVINRYSKKIILNLSRQKITYDLMGFHVEGGRVHHLINFRYFRTKSDSYPDEHQVYGDHQIIAYNIAFKPDVVCFEQANRDVFGIRFFASYNLDKWEFISEDIGEKHLKTSAAIKKIAFLILTGSLDAASPFNKIPIEILQLIFNGMRSYDI